MKKHINSSSIVKRLRIFIFLIVVIQTIMFVTFLILGGVIDEGRISAYQLFHEKTSSRNAQLQLKLKNNWTKFDPYVDNIADLLTSDEVIDSDTFFEKAVPELITMLRTTETTGAYIILDCHCQNCNNQLPALYLRDYDPFMNPPNNEDIYMVYGSSELANELKLPLDHHWRNNFITNDDMDFLKNPCQNTHITSDASLLGYWSKPFNLDGDDNPIITYSIPLIDKFEEVRGVIGIEINLDFFYKYLPATELQPRDSLGYLVGYRDDSQSPISPLIMGGALQRRMIDETQPLSLEPVDIDRNIYLIKNHQGKEDLYASIEEVSLYKNNTPFENEEWYLIGIMRGDYMLRYTYNIRNILWISFFIAIILGLISAYFISIRVSKPIVRLSNQIRKANHVNKMNFDKTGFLEIDELINAIELANRKIIESSSKLDKIVELLDLPIAAYEINFEENTVFTTQSFFSVINYPMPQDLENIGIKSFKKIMSEISSSPIPEEENIYEIGKDKDTKWIHLEENHQVNSTIGVVLDVTDDILEKKQILKERDQDPLTTVLNRKGFQLAYESWFDNNDSQGQAALIMFDMDNLKMINDTFGHQWGDKYILKLVEHLKKSAPKEKSFIGRRSGDEFLVLLYGFKDKNEIRNWMDDLYEDIDKNPIKYPNDKTLPITVSAGIMWIDDYVFTYGELLHYADEALYMAKKKNKGFYVENIDF